MKHQTCVQSCPGSEYVSPTSSLVAATAKSWPWLGVHAVLSKRSVVGDGSEPPSSVRLNRGPAAEGHSLSSSSHPPDLGSTKEGDLDPPPVTLTSLDRRRASRVVESWLGTGLRTRSRAEHGRRVHQHLPSVLTEGSPPTRQSPKDLTE